jgi:hypothetical protein
MSKEKIGRFHIYRRVGSAEGQIQNKRPNLLDLDCILFRTLG